MYRNSFNGMVPEHKKALSNLYFLNSKKQAKDKKARSNYKQVNLQSQQKNLHSG